MTLSVTLSVHLPQWLWHLVFHWTITHQDIEDHTFLWCGMYHFYLWTFSLIILKYAIKVVLAPVPIFVLCLYSSHYKEGSCYCLSQCFSTFFQSIHPLK